MTQVELVYWWQQLFTKRKIVAVKMLVTQTLTSGWGCRCEANTNVPGAPRILDPPLGVLGGVSSIGVALVVVARLRDDRLVHWIVCYSWLVLSTSGSPLPHAVFGLRAGPGGFTFVGVALKRCD